MELLYYHSDIELLSVNIFTNIWVHVYKFIYT